MSALHTIEFIKSNLSFRVDVVCYNESVLFDENWKGSDIHVGGVTVKNPEADRNSWAYFTPEFSLKERTAVLIGNGVPADQASGEAYKNAVRDLVRDIHANDYGFRLTVLRGDTVIINSEPVGCSFDYSHHDQETLEVAANDVFNGNGVEFDCLSMAVSAAQNIVDGVKDLQAFINENKGS